MILPTPKWCVWSLTEEHGLRESKERVLLQKKLMELQSEVRQLAAEHLQRQGYCVLEHAVSSEQRERARSSLQPLLSHFQRCYDREEDEFKDIDPNRFGIVRFPRIGKGKHNLHFDPNGESEQHNVLAELASAAGLHQLLSISHDGKAVSLRETGVSMTAPNGGDGMEFHSDGPHGENTMLMTLDQNVTPQMGALLIVPSSHQWYVSGVGHAEGSIDLALCDASKVAHLYRAGEPVLIDARLLHAVAPNVSSSWRVVAWFIFDTS